MKFAQKLRQLRDAAGLSEAKLAELSGVALGALHTYGLEKGGGSRRPSFSAVVKIAKALGTTCEAFAECEDIADDTPKKPGKKRAAK